MSDIDNPLRPVCTAWIKNIRLAWEFKKKQFQDDADEALAFFNGPYDFLYSSKSGRTSSGFAYGATEEGEMPKPTFQMTVNKVAELVQLFGPALYHSNPNRKVNPRQVPLLPVELFGDPNDPNIQMMYQQMMAEVSESRRVDQARGTLLEAYLNYTPNALDLKTESRWAIDEAIIKGMGVLWPEVYQPAGATMKLAGSFYDTVDNLLLDPDAEIMRDCKWIARRCIHPYWEVEEIYGLPQDSLKKAAGLESFNRQGEVAAHMDGDYRRKQGTTNDLIVYWKIWSKMGLGGRMLGMQPAMRDLLEPYGRFTFLVLAENVPFPLNVPQQIVTAAFGEDEMLKAPAAQELSQRIQWPIPFWADDTWPFEPIIFHSIPRRIWPMSHIAPAMGELKFLNWAFSFLAGKVRTATRDFLCIAKSAGEELKDRVKHGSDYTVIEVEMIHESIDKVVKFLQHPTFNPEIYNVIKAVADNFERRTGLSELMYGLSNHQMRSAQEAHLKSDHVNVRPDDMASKVEDAMSGISRKEALVARWHLTGVDVAPVLGQLGAQWWDSLITNSKPEDVLHQLEYRVEAGSAKKPNKSTDQANMSTAMQTLFTPFFQFASATGNVTPVNNLITAWAKSMDMDPSGLVLPSPPPPPAPAGPAGPGAPPAGPPHPGPPAPPHGAGGPPQGAHP